MIKIEHAVFPSTEQMKFIIENMRNPMNSRDKSDSNYSKAFSDCKGDNDLFLMQHLAKFGTGHRKFMRMMPTYARITAPLYWWEEFDTYKVGTVANSYSTMHKIAEKEFILDDFSTEHMDVVSRACIETTIGYLNLFRKEYVNDVESGEIVKTCHDKEIWCQMIQLLPNSYNQTRNVMMNYEVLTNIYKSRKDHKLDEWREFCVWIKSIPYSELIVTE